MVSGFVLKLVGTTHAGVTERHFKEKLPRVLGLGNSTPDTTTMTTAVRGLMFGDYIVPGQLHFMHISCTLAFDTSCSFGSHGKSTELLFRGHGFTALSLQGQN